jgi:hypothetical protein
LAAGKSGGESLPATGEGDAAKDVKASEDRGRFWRTIDFLTLCGAEVCPMDFTEQEMGEEIAAVLDGSRLDKGRECPLPHRPLRAL